jgi:plasmid stability protein
MASSDSIDSMATLTIRQLDEKTKTRLRIRAAHHGRSMEEEAREILRSALTAASPAKGNLAETGALLPWAGSNLSCRDATLCAEPRNLANDYPRH